MTDPKPPVLSTPFPSANVRPPRSVATKILLYILLFSSCVTLIVTFYQLYEDYQEQVHQVDERMEQIDRSYHDSLGNAIWFLNERQIESILSGVMQFEDVHFVSVEISDGETLQQGARRGSDSVRRFDVDVAHTVQDRTQQVGHLSIESNLDGVFERLSNKFWLILISQGLKTFLVSIFILFTIHYLVTRHLRTIAGFARTLDISQTGKFLSLARPADARPNELDQITEAMNQMKHDLIEDAAEKEQADLSLRKLSRAVDQSPAIVLILDSDGRIEYANKAFERAYGHGFDDVVGTKSDALIFGSQELGDYTEIWSAVSSGKEWRGEIHTQRKDGSWLWESASASSIIGSDGEITHYVVLKNDISELKKLEEQLELERDYLIEEVNSTGNFREIVGESEALKATFRQVEAVAGTSASVMILGESGVGKEMIARAIHTHSLRADKPMVKVNCASIPNELFESEFFGHVKGAFTGAHQDRIGRLQLADGGTLFLDEVGEIPSSQQGKLLRALQEGEFERVGDDKTIKVDVRIIAATNRNMADEIKVGRFREDLFYRLNVFPVEVPPLRDRKDDVMPLALKFLEDACKELNRGPFSFNQSQVNLLQQHNWSGNIRELKNTIERAVISSNGGRLKLDIALGSVQPSETGTADITSLESRGFLTNAEFKKLEKENIIAALKHAGWKTWGEEGAAALLGVKPSTLAYQMKTLGIKKP